MGLINLTAQQKGFYLEELKSALSSKKLFLNVDFSLPDLAKETGIQLYILSHIINSEFNLNFKDYINLMRIEYFMEKVNDPLWKDFTIEKKTRAAGFRSRATCHRAFLKHIGKTPSAYLNENRIEWRVPRRKIYDYR